MIITTRRRAATLAILTTAALGALTVAPSQGVAGPVPEPSRHSATTGPSPAPYAAVRARPCFTWRSSWDTALDGTEPTCPRAPTP